LRRGQNLRSSASIFIPMFRSFSSSASVTLRRSPSVRIGSIMSGNSKRITRKPQPRMSVSQRQSTSIGVSSGSALILGCAHTSPRVQRARRPDVLLDRWSDGPDPARFWTAALGLLGVPRCGTVVWCWHCVRLSLGYEGLANAPRPYHRERGFPLRNRKSRWLWGPWQNCGVYAGAREVLMGPLRVSAFRVYTLRNWKNCAGGYSVAIFATGPSAPSKPPPPVGRGPRGTPARCMCEVVGLCS